MDIESVPIEHTCLGCKRYFLLHESLPLESMTIEFKNYAIPIKENYLKSVLVKTVVAFMNSKGGTILMGVDDSSGKVEGMTLGRKQMDEFRLVVKHMLEKVVPAIDLVKEEEVCVEFIPVLEDKERYFYGKYVIKFIVRQGDISKLYCVSEKAQSYERNSLEVISAFRRHNLGGIEELKGIQVIQQIYEKARNPYKPYNTFHKDCNPQPIMPALLQRPKPEKVPKFFVAEDSPESSHQDSSHRSSSENKKSTSQVSQNDTIIDKIKQLDKATREHRQSKRSQQKIEKIKENQFKVLSDTGFNVYFENVRDVSIPKLINFLKNSTPAKYAQQITNQKGIIRASFKSRTERDGLIEYMSKDPYKRLMNEFGSNGKVHLLTVLSRKQMRISAEKRSRSRSPTPSKDNGNKNNSYRLLFYKYTQSFEANIENYLKNCINSNLKRKLKRTNEGLQLVFENKRDMYAVYDLCSSVPHSRQLSQFWPKNSLKIMKLERIIADKHSSGKDEQNSAQKPKIQSQKRNLPQIMNIMDKMDEQNKPRKSIDIQSMQLIASSLQPSEVSKLSNYLVNNMFYNIQKKIFASKDRYYIRIVFNSTQDCKEFMDYCILEQHKHMLAQFAGSKAFRIGVPGENLIITPYSDSVKEDLKKLIVKLLGMSAIKKSSVKEVNGQKVWCLTLVDPSKVLEYYEKLESFLRKQGFFINNEWQRFKVFLDYMNLTQ